VIKSIVVRCRLGEPSRQAEIHSLREELLLRGFSCPMGGGYCSMGGGGYCSQVAVNFSAVFQQGLTHIEICVRLTFQLF
jgi:hypothetical protein